MESRLSQIEVQHLLHRIGFGDPKSVIDSYIGQSSESILKDQFNIAKNYTVIDFPDKDYHGENSAVSTRNQNQNKLRKLKVQDVNVAWMISMANEKSGILDKMALFWHDHFACSSNNPAFILGYVQTIRKHALGNFGELLKAISKQAAMLEYLNNQQNRKKAPNENFAREVMELFTLGRDNVYSENDIKEAARAFTGWGFTKNGDFVNRESLHDDTEKEFLGHKGYFKGDDILEILLKRPETAYYLSEKMVTYFVNPHGDKDLQNDLARVFYESNYDIKKTLLVLFKDKFYDNKNIGIRIKSPVELIIGIQRMNHLKIEDRESLLYLQRYLGQVLLYPPNVSGWPDGKSWVDSSTLLFRLELPELLFKVGYKNFQLEESFDAKDEFFTKKRINRLVAIIDYNTLEKDWRNTSIQNIWNYYNQLPSSLNLEKCPEQELKDKLIMVMSQPEYQLC